MDFTNPLFWAVLLPFLFLFWGVSKLLDHTPLPRTLLIKLAVLLIALALLILTSWEILAIFLLAILLSEIACRYILSHDKHARKGLLITLTPLLIWLMSKLPEHRAHPRQIFQKLAILTISLTLLGMASWQTLLIFLTVMLICYGGCRYALRHGARTRRLILIALIPLLLTPLLYYKYAYFFGHALLDEQWDTLRDLIIPVGISFYSFQLAGFCVDTLQRNLPMPELLDYMNFGAFFPQIVAGPIERREQLLPQLEQLDIRFTEDKIQLGLRYIIVGLFFKMVLGDNLALSVNPDYPSNSAWYIWYSNICFSLRIYFDFCGYGLTAYGVAHALGIKLTMNFLSPYTASNISEFWRRWHVSLTNWFRDYIYIPLGGNRTRFWFINTLIVFAISGLWHGANWNFIIWGLLAGVAILTHRFYKKLGLRMWSALGIMLTMSYMVFVWMFFYVSSWDQLMRFLGILFTAESYDLMRGFYHLTTGRFGINTSTSLLAILLSFIVIMGEYFSLKKTKNPYALLTHPICCTAMVYLLVVYQSSAMNQFIYFAF